MLHPSVSSFSTRALSVAAASAAAATTWYTTTGCQEQPEDSFRVEVHLMDKIQQKSYLQSAKDGIPSKLRILAVDLPELRTDAFSGVCRLSHDKIFIDEVAPPKVIAIVDKNDPVSKEKKKQQKLKVDQKALVKVSGITFLMVSQLSSHSNFHLRLCLLVFDSLSESSITANSGCRASRGVRCQSQPPQIAEDPSIWKH
jgi:hypothetical protein